MDDELIMRELRELVLQGDNLKNYPNYDQPIKKWRGRSTNLLKLRFGSDSDYYQDFIKEVSCSYEYSLAMTKV